MLDDLGGWRHLYVAGRMHKPVVTLTQHQGVAQRQEANVRAATATALLLLPRQFNLDVG